MRKYFLKKSIKGGVEIILPKQIIGWVLVKDA